MSMDQIGHEPAGRGGQIQRSTIEHQQEFLMVKVVANLDLPGALSITNAPRGPRSA